MMLPAIVQAPTGNAVDLSRKQAKSRHRRLISPPIYRWVQLPITSLQGSFRPLRDSRAILFR